MATGAALKRTFETQAQATITLAGAKWLVLLLALLLGPMAVASPAQAQSSVDLGTARQFAVLAGAGVTNTGPTVVNGDLGTSPTPAVTGFPPGEVNGEIHAGDPVAAEAQDDLTTAYNEAAGAGPGTTVNTELGGQTLTPGVYDSQSGTFEITGTLTLDAEGDPNAVFIFQTESTLITASGSRVRLINGAQACNIFWQVGSSATLGTNSIFKGNILALTDITANAGATVDGRLLARNGAVTLNNNTITRATCATGGGGGGGGGDDDDGDDGDDDDSDDGDDGDDDDSDGGGGPTATPTPTTGGPTTTPTSAPTIRLSVTPTPVAVGRNVRYVFRAYTYINGVRRVLPGVSVFFDGQRVTTNSLGVATIVTRFTRPGVKHAYASRPGMRRTTARVVAVSPEVRQPRFTG